MLQDLCEGVSNEQLNAVCLNSHLEKLAKEIDTWQELHPFFFTDDSVTDSDLDAADALQIWKTIKDDSATYQNLLQILCKAHRLDLAEVVHCQLLSMDPEEEVIFAEDRVKACVKPYVGESREALTSVRTYLEECYIQEPAPCITDWPVKGIFNYVNPTLFQIPESSSGSLLAMGRQASPKYHPLEIADIFKATPGAGKKQLILLEGAAGAGKSTLACHIKRKWAKQECFEHISHVIYLSVNDPYVQSAKSLTDVIPSLEEDVKKAVAGLFDSTGGEGVAFIIDGWDEVLDQKHDEMFISQLVHGKMLPKATFLILSRPLSSSTLRNDASSKLYLSGFSRMQTEEYLTTNLASATSIDVKKILNDNPTVATLCELPLHAAIVSLILREGDPSVTHLPETQTELLKHLAISLLLRHREEKEVFFVDDILSNFDALPPNLHELFKKICSLAFTNAMQGRSIFDLDDLRAYGITETGDVLPLLRHTSTLFSHSSAASYKFLHLSLQEYLAAIHISSLPVDQQMVSAEILLESNLSSFIIPFFCGVKGIESFSVMKYLSSMHEEYDTGLILRYVDQKQRILIQLCHCIFEAQTAPDHLWLWHKNNAVVVTGNYLALNPLDFNSLCYGNTKLVQEKLKRGNYNAQNQLVIGFHFAASGIHDSQASLLVDHFRNLDSTADSCLTVSLNFEQNRISHSGVGCLSNFIQSTSMIYELDLSGNWSPEETDIDLALKLLVEGLSQNNSLNVFNLAINSLTVKHSWYLFFIFLVGTRLVKVDLSWNYIHLGVTILSLALAVNKSLVTLLLSVCGITDAELFSLGKALTRNRTIETLVLSYNAFSSSAFVCFLRMLQQESYISVILTDPVTDEMRMIVNEINFEREKKGLKNLELLGLLDKIQRSLEPIKDRLGGGYQAVEMAQSLCNTQ